MELRSRSSCASTRWSSQDTTSTTARIATVSTTTSIASHSFCRPSPTAAPQMLPSGKRAAAMPV